VANRSAFDRCRTSGCWQLPNYERIMNRHCFLRPMGWLFLCCGAGQWFGHRLFNLRAKDSRNIRIKEHHIKLPGASFSHLELFGGVAVVLTCSSHPTALMLILLATRSCCNVAPFHPLKVSKRPVTAVRQMGQAWRTHCYSHDPLQFYITMSWSCLVLGRSG